MGFLGMSLPGGCGDIFLHGFRGEVLGLGKQEVLASCVCPGGQRSPITEKPPGVEEGRRA